MPNFNITVPCAGDDISSPFVAFGTYDPLGELRKLLDGQTPEAYKLWEKLLAGAKLTDAWDAARKEKDATKLLTPPFLRLLASLPLTCKVFKKNGANWDEWDKIDAELYCSATLWKAHFGKALPVDGEYQFKAQLVDGPLKERLNLFGNEQAIPGTPTPCPTPDTDAEEEAMVPLTLEEEAMVAAAETAVKAAAGALGGALLPFCCCRPRKKKAPAVVLANYPQNPHAVAAVCLVYETTANGRQKFVRALTATPHHGFCEFIVPIPKDAATKSYFAQPLLLNGRGGVVLKPPKQALI